jgi:hypothetical protein
LPSLPILEARDGGSGENQIILSFAMLEKHKGIRQMFATHTYPDTTAFQTGTILHTESGKMANFDGHTGTRNRLQGVFEYVILGYKYNVLWILSLSSLEGSISMLASDLKIG